LKRIMGKQTSEIEKILGYYYYNEVIHRDNLVVMPKSET
jgi:glutamate 5-kinase